MDAIIYLRVSTKDQSDRGYSLPTQEQDCQAYAQRNGLEVVRVYREDESGFRLDRTELTKVRADLSRKLADVLIVHESDRLTREPEHSIILRNELARTGVQLHYAMRGEVRHDDLGDQITEDIRARVAKDEVRRIVERTRRGKRGKVANGSVIVAQRPPYGYKLDNGQLVIDEAQAEVVRLIFRLYTVEGWSIRAIAEKLTTDRVPTPADSNPKIYKKSGYGVWSKTLVRSILGRETYTGVWHWGKTTREVVITGAGRYVTPRLAPRENWIAVTVPAIVDRETFTVAQARFIQNKAMASRSTKREYLMAKRLVCNCGLPVYAEPKHTPTGLFVYYTCSSRHSGSQIPPCGLRHFPVKWIDDNAWQYVKNLLADPARMAELINAKMLEMQAQQPDLPGKVAQKRREITRKEQAIERLARKYINGGESEKVFDKLRGELDADLSRLRGELTDLETEQADHAQLDALLRLSQAMQSYERVLLRDDEPFEIKKGWIEAFNLRGRLWMQGKERMVTFSWYAEELVLSPETPLPRSNARRSNMTHSPASTHTRSRWRSSRPGSSAHSE